MKKPSERIKELTSWEQPSGACYIPISESVIYNHYRLNAIIDFLDEQYEEKEQCEHKTFTLSKSTRNGTRKICNNCGINYSVSERNALIDEKKKYKMTFEVICDFDNLVDKDVFEKEYDNDIYKICKDMYESDGLGWFDEDLRLTKAEFIP